MTATRYRALAERSFRHHTPHFEPHLIPKVAQTTPVHPRTWQVRYDIVGSNGTIFLRHAGHLTHPGIGCNQARTEIICLIHRHDATAITHTGDVLGEYTINSTKDYQTKNT